MKDFLKKVQAFNEIYQLRKRPVDSPRLPTRQELENFKSILQEELEELDAIIEQVRSVELLEIGPEHEFYQAVMADLADWYGDMIVYPHTHSDKYGFPTGEILDVIMDSNMSKLDEHGNPIYDERGKVIKGPNYWRPEPKILDILQQKIKGEPS